MKLYEKCVGGVVRYFICNESLEVYKIMSKSCAVNIAYIRM